MNQNTVFISYRRTSQYPALAVFKSLREQGYDVFFDYESIDTGDFEQIILRQIAARVHFVLILAPGTLDRCMDDPNDMVRQEIEEAIRLKRNIIPLLFDGFDIGNIPRMLLPGKLSVLPSYNALPIPKELMYFDHAMQLLRDRFLSKLQEGVIHPTPSEDINIVQQKIAIVENKLKPIKEDLTADEYNLQGTELNKLYEYDDAIIYFSKAIHLNPQKAIYYTNRSLARSEKGDYDGAINDCSEAIKLDPNHATAYSHRSYAHNLKEDYNRAIFDASEALRLNPKHTNAYRNRGYAYMKIHNYAASNADYYRYLDLGGKEVDLITSRIRDNEEKLRKRH